MLTKKKIVKEDRLFCDRLVILEISHSEYSSLALLPLNSYWVIMPQVAKRKDFKEEFLKFQNFLKQNSISATFKSIDCSLNTLNATLDQYTSKKPRHSPDQERQVREIIQQYELERYRGLSEESRIEKIQQNLQYLIYDILMTQPDIHKERNRHIPEKVKAAVLERNKEVYNGCCTYCGNEPDEINFDHLFPYSLGGAQTELNLVVSCKSCNLEKGTKIEYLKSGIGKHNLLENIKEFVSKLPMVTNFVSWLKDTAKAGLQSQKSDA